MLRGSGMPWDLRKKQPYEVYDRMDFDIPVGVNGDCYDRYLVRIEEMRQSQPHHQAVHRAGCARTPARCIIDDHKVAPPSRGEMKVDMEELIHHFKLFTEGMHVPAGRGLRRGRAPEGRVRHLPRLRRRQQAVPLQDPRAGLPAPRGARRDGAGPHARRRRRRSSARWTSCSGRSTDERRMAMITADPEDVPHVETSPSRRSTWRRPRR